MAKRITSNTELSDFPTFVFKLYTDAEAGVGGVFHALHGHEIVDDVYNAQAIAFNSMYLYLQFDSGAIAEGYGLNAFYESMLNLIANSDTIAGGIDVFYATLPLHANGAYPEQQVVECDVVAHSTRPFTPAAYSTGWFIYSGGQTTFEIANPPTNNEVILHNDGHATATECRIVCNLTGLIAGHTYDLGFPTSQDGSTPYTLDVSGVEGAGNQTKWENITGHAVVQVTALASTGYIELRTNNFEPFHQVHLVSTPDLIAV